VDVRAAAFRGGKILLVRERSDGRWTMPRLGRCGGCAASLLSGSVEEAGFRVKARKLVGVYDANRFEPLEIMHAYKLVFLCEVIEARPPQQRNL